MVNDRAICPAGHYFSGPNALRGDPALIEQSGIAPVFGSRISALEPTMTRDQFSDITITTTNEFRDALAVIVETAIKEDVDVRGAWEFQTAGSIYNWEVEVVELAKDLEDDE